jgi:hypothetical protein
MSSLFPEISASEGSEAGFDHARHLLLSAFRLAVAAHNIPPDLISEEIESTASAMRQIAALEGRP